jgi:PKD repeat protein
MNLKMNISLLIICILFFCGCINNTPEEPELQISTTEIRISDSPITDFTHVNVSFSDLKVRNNKKDWITIPLETTTIDLLYLYRNNITRTLGIGKIESGNYTCLQFTFTNATGITNEGKNIYFELPSNMLQIQHIFEFEKGNNTISVDINLSNSIHAYEYENEHLYKLQPVISELNVSYANGTMIRFRNRERIINYANGTQIRHQEENILQNMIGNRKPTIDLTINNKRGKAFQFKTNQTIMFNASGTFDVDNDPMNFSWDFGDNTTGIGKIVNHTYTQQGTYQIRLTVSDNSLHDMTNITLTINKTDSPGNGN